MSHLFRILVPGVIEYIGRFPGQQQAAHDAERRYPGAMPASTFLLTPPNLANFITGAAHGTAPVSENGHRVQPTAHSTGPVDRIPLQAAGLHARGRGLVSADAYPARRAAPDQHFASGVGSSRPHVGGHRRAGASGLAVASWCLVAAVAVILSASYLLDGPIKSQAAQAVADEAAYAAALADGGAAKCAGLGRTPIWTPNGDLICRLPARPHPSSVTVAQGGQL